MRRPVIDPSDVEQAIASVAGVEFVERHESLFEDGLDLDSLGFLNLMLSLEELTGQELKTGLDEAAVSSVGALVNYVVDADSG